MCDALDRIEEKGEMRGVVKLGKSLGWTDDEIISKLVEIFKINRESAKALLSPMSV